MFSGLIRELARVRRYENQILCLESNLAPDIGDSIAINGICLTAISSASDHFCVRLSDESAKSVAVENLHGVVHMEPALRLSDGLHGHIVQGHIDAIGRIVRREALQNQTLIHIQADAKALGRMIDKGSVCIDGVSLTINRVLEDCFELVVIPHTMQNTLLHSYEVGRRVNIETDIIVRTLEALLKRHTSSQKGGISQDFLDSMALGY